MEYYMICHVFSIHLCNNKSHLFCVIDGELMKTQNDTRSLYRTAKYIIQRSTEQTCNNGINSFARSSAFSAHIAVENRTWGLSAGGPLYPPKDPCRNFLVPTILSPSFNIRAIFIYILCINTLNTLCLFTFTI